MSAAPANLRQRQIGFACLRSPLQIHTNEIKTKQKKQTLLPMSARYTCDTVHTEVQSACNETQPAAREQKTANTTESVRHTQRKERVCQLPLEGLPPEGSTRGFKEEQQMRRHRKTRIGLCRVPCLYSFSFQVFRWNCFVLAALFPLPRCCRVSN